MTKHCRASNEYGRDLQKGFFVDLRWYQGEAVDATWRHLCEVATNPLIVAPTGSGKSVIIAALVQKAVTAGGRVLVLAHRKELLTQNAEKMRAFGLTVGINSAGLRLRDIDSDVICCGIQSVYNKAAHFGRRHLVLIDEAHLVPRTDDGIYRQFLTDLRAINPRFFIVGLTATPYRMDSGKLYGPNELFERVSFDIPLGRLIAEGYLSRLTCRPAVTEFDTSQITIRGGEFVESSMQAAFDKDELTLPACREIVAATKGRRSILVFCAGVDHAEHVREAIYNLTQEAVGIVTGESTALERSSTLRSFKAGQLRWLVNVDVLTTGFDAPQVDTICALRATQSPGLWSQICGRGLRIAEGKQDCLILDFGGNVKRHGPLDDPAYGVQREASSNAGGPVEAGGEKGCPGCGNPVPAQTRVCGNCGFKWPTPKPHESAADKDAAILLEELKPVKRIVEEMRVGKHFKKKTADPNAPPTLRVDYLCTKPGGGNIVETISEWVCIEHDGFARQKAVKWWKQHSYAPMPSTVDEAIEIYEAGFVAPPEEITTVQDGKFQRITGAEIPEPPAYEPGEAMPITNKAQEIIDAIRATGADIYLVGDELCRMGELSDEHANLAAEHYDEIVAAIKQDLAEVPF